MGYTIFAICRRKYYKEISESVRGNYQRLDHATLCDGGSQQGAKTQIPILNHQGCTECLFAARLLIRFQASTQPLCESRCSFLS